MFGRYFAICFTMYSHITVSNSIHNRHLCKSLPFTVSCWYCVFIQNRCIVRVKWINRYIIHMNLSTVDNQYFVKKEVQWIKFRLCVDVYASCNICSDEHIHVYIHQIFCPRYGFGQILPCHRNSPKCNYMIFENVHFSWINIGLGNTQCPWLGAWIFLGFKQNVFRALLSEIHPLYVCTFLNYILNNDRARKISKAP
jgi:hypothetical protein